MYKEVEINTPLELARYLVNEGDLYAGEQKIRLTAEALVQYNSPFRFINRSGGSSSLNAEWGVSGGVYYKKTNWHDCIPGGKKVPCYVSDTNNRPTEADSSAQILGYAHGEDKPYKSTYHAWRYATPIPADELWVPEL